MQNSSHPPHTARRSIVYGQKCNLPVADGSRHVNFSDRCGVRRLASCALGVLAGDLRDVLALVAAQQQFPLLRHAQVGPGGAGWQLVAKSRLRLEPRASGAGSNDRASHCQSIATSAFPLTVPALTTCGGHEFVYVVACELLGFDEVPPNLGKPVAQIDEQLEQFIWFLFSSTFRSLAWAFVSIGGCCGSSFSSKSSLIQFSSSASPNKV